MGPSKPLSGKPPAPPAPMQPRAKRKPVKFENPVTVVMQRSCKAGDEMLDVLDPVAEIQLRPGVSLDYLAHALTQGVCGPKTALQIASEVDDPLDGKEV